MKHFPTCGAGVRNRWNPAHCARLLGHPGMHRRRMPTSELRRMVMVLGLVRFLTAGAAR